ncbi:MAG: serine/threonine-protein kinase [Archangium sp.]|nr:serine/threonine-protein kinase [Archangium sp.]
MACSHSSSDDCRICAATLDGDSAGDTMVRGEHRAPEGSLAPGTPIGRYLVLDRLGQGGMGTLYTAHDPQLQRVVAIKVLRSRVDHDASQTAGQQRLLREAQAMAQLSHPNVVPVYDSGPFGEGVFIAMELVRGSTLDHWVKLKPRSWQEVLALFLQAGRGLEAAHAAGLIHRDFKPANVLVGEEGRPRVTDFGLARATRSITLPEVMETPEVMNSGPLSFEEPLTQAGSMMGSPGYMAHEQYVGAATSAATDQFSFCVALYEALYEVKPFVAKTLPDLEVVTARGEVPPAPKGSPVPGWIHRILVTGLNPRPELRHASMTVLLAALARDPALHRRRVSVAAAVVVLLLSTGGFVWWSSVRQARACQGADALLAGVWDEGVKKRSEASFLSTAAPFAKASWVLTRDALDGWAKQWVAARTEACEATRVRGEQTERQLLLRFECLDRRLIELGALAEAFGAADKDLVASAGTAAARLSPLSSCTNVKQLEDRRAPPPELEQTARELAQQLAQSRALSAAGRLTDSRARLTPTVKRAQQLKLPALESEGLEALGELEQQARNFTEARRAFEGAVRAAEVAGDDPAAARVLARLVSLVGWRMDKPDEARTWAALAGGVVERIGGDRLTEAHLAEGIGDTEWQAGQRAFSLIAYRKSLALYLEEQGEESLDVARLRSAVGWVLTEQGELSAAREELQKSRLIRERLLGSGHPTLGVTWNELSVLAMERRDTHEALRCAKLTEEIALQFGLDSPRLARSKFGVALMLVLDGKPQEGLEAFERLRPLLGRGTEELGDALSDYQRGHVLGLTRVGRLKEALAEGHTWLAENERLHGKVHPEVAALADAVAEAEFEAGRFAEAIEGSERYLAMKAALGGADSPLTGQTLLRSARAHLALGKAVEAAPRAERALVALEKGPLERGDRGEARLVLAQALLRSGGEKARVLLLAQQAKEDALAVNDEKLLARIAALER